MKAIKTRLSVVLLTAAANAAYCGVPPEGCRAATAGARLIPVEDQLADQAAASKLTAEAVARVKEKVIGHGEELDDLHDGLTKADQRLKALEAARQAAEEKAAAETKKQVPSAHHEVKTALDAAGETPPRRYKPARTSRKRDSASERDGGKKEEETLDEAATAAADPGSAGDAWN